MLNTRMNTRPQLTRSFSEARASGRMSSRDSIFQNGASPERRRSMGSSRAVVSPHSCYTDTTEAMMDPISPRSAGARSLGMDEDTYNFFIGAPQQQQPTQDTGLQNKCSDRTMMLGGMSPNEQRQETTSSNPGETDPASLGIIEASPGTFCYPKQILAEGWLQKKGSGTDWMGSRGWKTRWARLCMAQVIDEESAMSKNMNFQMQQEQLIQVPILLLFWFPASTTVSTAIVLDSTVVLGKDLEDESKWNPFRFEIRHATTQENATLAMTRVFAAPQAERDAWVYAISQALLVYEKEKDRVRKQVRRQPRFFRAPPKQRHLQQRMAPRKLSGGHSPDQTVTHGPLSPPPAIQRPLSPSPMHSGIGRQDEARPIPLAPPPKFDISTPFSQAV